MEGRIPYRYCCIASANSDYVPLREEFVFTATSPNTTCVTLQTLRDNAIEGTEALVILLVDNVGITTGPEQHLTILPANDSKYGKEADLEKERVEGICCCNA